MQRSIDQDAGSTATAKQTHPAWLQHEINKATLRKQHTEDYSQQQHHKHQLVSQQAQQTRQRIRATQPTQPQPQQQQQHHTINFIDNQRPATCTPHGRPQSGRAAEKGKPKPKWAMTAAEEEAEMEAECEDLVGFVDELNFDQWMEGVEKRVEEEKENETDQAEHESDEAIRPETLGEVAAEEPASGWDANLPRPPTGIRPSTQSTKQRPATASNNRPHTARPASTSTAADKTQQLVATLFNSSSTIRNIHSSHSLRALVASAQQGGSRVQQCVSVPAANSVSVAISEPLLSVLQPRETVHGKVNPSLLPYLHRHPAV